MPVKHLRPQLKRDKKAGYTPDEYDRPRVRAQCEQVGRPCPYVSCVHHLYLDVNPESGTIKYNHPDIDPLDMPHTCALDVADIGGVVLEDVSVVMNMTRERVRQLEMSALNSLRTDERFLQVRDEMEEF